MAGKKPQTHTPRDMRLKANKAAPAPSPAPKGAVRSGTVKRGKAGK